MIWLAIGFCILIMGIFEFARYVKKRRRLPPGPFRWPVIGNIVELAMSNSQSPHLALDEMARKYGEIVSFGFGIHEAVLVSTYDAMKIIFTNEEIYGRYALPFVFDRSFHERLGLAWSDGSMWRDLRKYSAKSLRESGSGRRDRSLQSALHEEIDEMLSIMKSRTSTDGVYDVDPIVFLSSGVNILWTLVAGFRFPHDDPTFSRLLDYSQAMMEIMGHANIYNPFPFLRVLFPKLTNFNGHKRIHAQTHELMREIINDARIKRAERSEDSDKPGNFIDAFIDEIDKNKGNNINGVFTEKQLMLVLMDLFLGGSESTGTMINWIVLFLTLNPKVQQKIQEELTNNLGPDGVISIEMTRRMVYTRATVYEVFRMAPVFPIPPPREAINNCYYKDYLIPKGTLVMLNLHPVLNDVPFWGDPHVFRPGRFLDATGTKLVLKYTERVAIFGFGKRICMGEAVAWDTLIMTAVKCMEVFTFEAIQGQEPSYKDPISRMALTPRPYKIRIHLR